MHFPISYPNTQQFIRLYDNPWYKIAFVPSPQISILLKPQLLFQFTLLIFYFFFLSFFNQNFFFQCERPNQNDGDTCGRIRSVVHRAQTLGSDKTDVSLSFSLNQCSTLVLPTLQLLSKLFNLSKFLHMRNLYIQTFPDRLGVN